MLKQYDQALVTGGNGFIGRHLVRALVSLGKEVKVMDHFSDDLEAALPDGATLVRGDILDPIDARRGARGCSIVFHLAANASGTRSVEEPGLDFRTNAVGTLNVLEATVSEGARRFVYISSASVYGVPDHSPLSEEHPLRPFMPYGASKLAGEHLCLSFQKTYGLSTVIARPFCVYGSGENPESTLVEVSRYLRWHLNQRTIQVIGSADQKTRDFVHVRDTVEGLLLLAERGGDGEAFNIGSGEETSMRQLVELVGDVVGEQAKLHEISEVTDDSYRLVAGISKIRSLGYSPKVSLEEGVRALAEGLGANPELPSGATIFRRNQRAERLLLL